MTKSKKRRASREGAKAQAPGPDPDSRLDAEILRDLEANARADDVRGGACPTSKPV